jgi:AraC-like DNA-binding protein
MDYCYLRLALAVPLPPPPGIKPFFMPLKRQDIRYIRKAKTIVTENFDKHLTIPELAKKAGINETKLKEGFRELYAQSIHDYLLQLRIAKAKHLLATTQVTIIDITYHVGYSNVTHFSSMFKKEVGVPPTEWRKKHKGKNKG